MEFWDLVFKISYPIGWVLAVVALGRPRTPQGAAAWVISLICIPFITIPLFVLFGRTKFKGYTKSQKKVDKKIKGLSDQVSRVISARAKAPEGLEPLNLLVRDNLQPGFMSSNELTLLIDGKKTYQAILDAIHEAKDYILFQFYIFEPDETGRVFLDALKKKAAQGVRVYFLVDQVGSSLGFRLKRELRLAGIEVAQFTSSKSWDTKFQINFRNHRKVVVVDGQCAFVGGINISHKYVSDKALGHWRDTHLKIVGTSALAAQVSFVKDWYWSAEKFPELNWDCCPTEENGDTLLIHTGPADVGNVCLLSYVHLVNSAKKRILIATPYFVPPEALSHALCLAVLRGVDVQIILPTKTDNLILKKASTIYIEALLKSGIKFHYYQKGFMHQKTMLVDDCGSVGSVNMDNRSIFINFEIIAFSTLPNFVKDLESMFDRDIKDSKPISLEDFSKRPFLRKMLARVVNLFAPIL